MNKEELDKHRRLLIEKVKELQQENKQLKEELENDIDRYEDTISYQLGFDKGKEYLQQRIDKAYNSLGILLQILEEQSGDKDIKWILERLNPIQEILGDKQ